MVTSNQRSTEAPLLDRLLLVDSNADERLRLATEFAAGGLAAAVFQAEHADDAIGLIPGAFSMVVVDAAEPPAGILRIVEATHQEVMSPLVVLAGSVSCPRAAFTLAKAGVHAYVDKPLSPLLLRERFATSSHVEELRLCLRSLTGRMMMKDVQHQVREILINDALSRAKGSRRSAARVLGITRPAVQKALRR